MPAVLDDRDPVGVVRREQPVRDRDHGAPVQHRRQRALEVPGGARVDQRGRLVEHQRVRVGQHQPGQRDLLGLGVGERAAAGPDDRVEPVGQRVHPLEGVDRGERPTDVVVGGARAARPARGSRAGCRRRRGAPG